MSLSPAPGLPTVGYQVQWTSQEIDHAQVVLQLLNLGRAGDAGGEHRPPGSG